MKSIIGIASRLVRMRAENGWRQEDLAARLGVSKSAVSQWESGMRTPRKVILLKIKLIEDGGGAQK